MNASRLMLAALLALGVFGVSLEPSPRLHASAAAEAARPAGSEAAAPTTVEGLMKALGLVRPPRPAPGPDFTVPLQAGETFRLSEQRGRVVFINFWATWCLPCREEMPTMERLWCQRLAGPFVMLAIALDANPAPGRALRHEVEEPGDLGAQEVDGEAAAGRSVASDRLRADRDVAHVADVAGGLKRLPLGVEEVRLASEEQGTRRARCHGGPRSDDRMQKHPDVWICRRIDAIPAASGATDRR
jgi:AhpC/TSA family protein